MENLYQFRVTWDQYAYPAKKASPVGLVIDLSLDSLCMTIKAANEPVRRIPHNLVQSFQRLEQTGTIIQVVLKTHDIWRFSFDSLSTFQRAYERMSQLTSSTFDSSKIFAYTFEMEELDAVPSSTESTSASLEYTREIFDIKREINRWQMSKNWRLSAVNQDFALSDSMPEKLIVPVFVDDTDLVKISSFRALNRLPTLVYYHRHNKAFIARSGQPLIGSKGKRSLDDEQYLKDLFGNRNIGPDGLPLPCIIDVRTRDNVTQAKSKGGGSESDGNASYVGIRTFYTTIENYQTIREYYDRFVDAVRNVDGSQSSFLSDVCGWMRLLQGCLRPAAFIARTVSQQASPCLIHCDEGVDSTCIIVSLAKMLLDPHYRTYAGFQELIEFDWIQYGHRFAERNCIQPFRRSQSNGGSLADTDSSLVIIPSISASQLQQQRSPIFLLFLDCVHQIWTQFPTEFEFNLELLAMIHQQTHTCQFGTFLVNCPKDVLELKENTYSLWQYLNAPQFKAHFINHFYDPISDVPLNAQILPISTDARRLRIWSGMYDAFAQNTTYLSRWNSAKFRVDVTGPLSLSEGGQAVSVDVTSSPQSSAVRQIRDRIRLMKEKLMHVSNERHLRDLSVISSPPTHSARQLDSKGQELVDDDDANGHGKVDKSDSNTSWDPLNVSPNV